MRKYQLDNVIIDQIGERQATWRFAKGNVIEGTEMIFRVVDNNYANYKRWEFLVRVPPDKDERLEVRPSKVPNLAAWADLEDRSLMFQKANRRPFSKLYYCKVSLSDPSGKKTRDGVQILEIDALPGWFKCDEIRTLAKQSVRTTEGTDGYAVVAIVNPKDYSLMIRLFFAMKVWVLKEQFYMPDVH